MRNRDFTKLDMWFRKKLKDVRISPPGEQKTEILSSIMAKQKLQTYRQAPPSHVKEVISRAWVVQRIRSRITAEGVITGALLGALLTSGLFLLLSRPEILQETRTSEIHPPAVSPSSGEQSNVPAPPPVISLPATSPPPDNHPARSPYPGASSRLLAQNTQKSPPEAHKPALLPAQYSSTPASPKSSQSFPSHIPYGKKVPRVLPLPELPHPVISQNVSPAFVQSPESPPTSHERELHTRKVTPVYFLGGFSGSIHMAGAVPIPKEGITGIQGIPQMGGGVLVGAGILTGKRWGIEGQMGLERVGYAWRIFAPTPGGIQVIRLRGIQTWAALRVFHVLPPPRWGWTPHPVSIAYVELGIQEIRGLWQKAPGHVRGTRWTGLQIVGTGIRWIWGHTRSWHALETGIRIWWGNLLPSRTAGVSVGGGLRMAILWGNWQGTSPRSQFISR